MTRTPIVTTVPVTGLDDTPGLYSQYDYPCPVALVPGKLPNGTTMPLCPNGLNADGTYKNINAFRTDGGMDWLKARNVAEYEQVPAQGGIFWLEWDKANPSDGTYNWAYIDSYVRYAVSNLKMENADGQLVPKAVVVKLTNAYSTRPAMFPPALGTDAQFEFDDHTPQWVKAKMKGPVTWGGPTILATGQKVTQDDGSYWVRAECSYDGYAYSIWIVPKYDRLEWQAAAKKFLQAISNHYNGTGLTFLIGLNGVDGEFSNFLQFSYAGCSNLQTYLKDQYGATASTMYVRDLPKWWNSETPAYMSYTSWADPSTWIGITPTIGLQQARITTDNPGYHRADGALGVIDWPMYVSITHSIAWENAYPTSDDAYVYQEFSLAAMTFPKWFDLMGGLWGANPSILREFRSTLGRNIRTTPEVWWKAYWSCFLPSSNGIPDCAGVSGSYTMYQGWPRDLEAGLVADRLLPVVNPSTMLTATQQKWPWAKMLRVLTDTVSFKVDERWQHSAQSIQIRFLDNSEGTILIKAADGMVVSSIAHSGTGLYRDVRQPSGVLGWRVTLQADVPVYLHGVSLWAMP